MDKLNNILRIAKQKKTPEIITFFITCKHSLVMFVYLTKFKNSNTVESLFNSAVVFASVVCAQIQIKKKNRMSISRL